MFLVDRKYIIKQVWAFNSEGHLSSRPPLTTQLTVTNVFDGELVLDEDESGALNALPTYLVFDCLVLKAKSLMHLNFRDRLRQAEEHININHTIFRLHLES